MSFYLSKFSLERNNYLFCYLFGKKIINMLITKFKYSFLYIHLNQKVTGKEVNQMNCFLSAKHNQNYSDESCAVTQLLLYYITTLVSNLRLRSTYIQDTTRFYVRMRAYKFKKLVFCCCFVISTTKIPINQIKASTILLVVVFISPFINFNIIFVMFLTHKKELAQQKVI